MTASSLFISDLHLDPERKEINEIFFRFLKQRALQADALYILGDLFEVWVGDDDLSDFNQQVITAFHEYSQHGKQLYLMHGNRDFLLGSTFVRQCDATLLEDPTVVELYGFRTLLCHGDKLCSLDQEYQDFRQTVRSAQWQQSFLARPLQERRQIANDLRRQSREKSQNKADNIMDVNPDDVLELVSSHRLDYLIHGHTHRPATHEINTDSVQCTRLVLSDWYKSGHCLELSHSGYKTETFSPGP